MLLLLPADFLTFWFVRAPLGILAYFSSLNSSYLRFFSFSLLLRTFFQPIKNEYRQGLVGFSIGIGILVRTVLLMIALFFFIVLLVAELVFLTSFILLPISSFVLFFLNL